MSEANVLTSENNGLLTITVNRPARLNALNTATIADLTRAFTDARDRREVRAVMLTGAGDKAFIAGADIAELAANDGIKAKSCSEFGQRLFDLVENLGKPVLAAINGFALGGGLETALACHVRIASEKAVLGLPETTLGIMPGFGGTQRLPRVIGQGRALEWILTGGKFDAQEAFRVGLVNKVVKPEQLLAETEAMARKMMANGPIALRSCIEAVNRGMETSLDQGQALEATLFGMLASTRDTREGLAAFLEKRKPDFRGE